MHIYLLISSPVLLVLLVFAGHPPAVHGVVDAGLAQLVRRGHIQHEVQFVPALVDVAQVQSGEVCKNCNNTLTRGGVYWKIRPLRQFAS